MKRNKLSSIAVAAVLVAGCGALNNGSGDDTPTPTPTPGNAVTIFDIQDATAENHPEIDTEVYVEGVLISAVIPDEDRTHLFLQDKAGGDYSGIYVYDQNGVAPTGLQIGDEVNISATYTEFNGASQLVLSTDIGTIDVVNTGGTLPFTSVSSADLGTINTSGARAAALEGVLVQIDGDVEVANPSVNNFGEFTVSNGSDELLVDDYIFADAEVGRSAGEQLTNLRGVLYFAFDEFKLEPRNTDDIPAGEVSPVTVQDIQDTGSPNHPGADSPVKLEAVVVTALPDSTCNLSGFWVADPAGGTYSGILIYDPNDTAPADLAVGDELTIEGTYVEFNDKSEISLQQSGTVTRTNTGVAIPAAEQVAEMDFETAGTEPYEGVLVAIPMSGQLSVFDEPNQYGEFTVSDDNGATTLMLDDCIYADADVGATQGAVVDSLTGIVDYSFGSFKVEPRSAADISIQ